MIPALELALLVDAALRQRNEAMGASVAEDTPLAPHRGRGGGGCGLPPDHKGDVQEDETVELGRVQIPGEGEVVTCVGDYIYMHIGEQDSDNGRLPMQCPTSARIPL